MDSTLLVDGDERTYALIFETGDDVMAGLMKFAKDRGLNAAHITAIGAFQDVTLGYFDWELKDYKRIQFHEQVEVLSLVGDIAEAEDGDEPQIHLHAVLGRSDASTIGGHLFEGRVRPTLEVILTETLARLRRVSDRQTGLALIKIR